MMPSMYRVMSRTMKHRSFPSLLTLLLATLMPFNALHAATATNPTGMATQTARSGAGHDSDNALVTELATDRVDITSQFTGEKILVFGAISSPGDVIIKVTSPNETVALTRKAELGPFWLSDGKIRISHAPGLLYLLSTRPIPDVLSMQARQQYGLRLEDALARAKPLDTIPKDMQDWQSAYLRLKKADGYYRHEDQAIHLVGNRLFSTSLDLPAKLPLGTYRLDIYLVKDGNVIAQQQRTLNVQQVRLEHWVSQTAHTWSWTFGISFVVFAMLLGLFLGVVLRKGRDD